MTVKELIEALKEHPKDKKVVVRSYESGYDEAISLESIFIEEDYGHDWWDGTYAHVYEDDRDENTIEAVQIIGG